MPEDIPSISSARLAAADVARHSFQTVRRGFDPEEVRAYLEQVARELAWWEQREQDLRRQVAEAEERARNPVVDEPTLTAALGQRSAQVLRSAHEQAAAIALRAEEEAAALVRDAQHRAAELRVDAESAAAERIAAAEVAVNSIDLQAREEVAALLDRSRRQAAEIGEEGRERGEALIAQAQAMRRRVLEDMAQRRRAMTYQIEQFRSARDELAASVLGLRQSVDEIAEELAHADDRARAAAAEVASRQRADGSADDLLGEVERAELELDGETEGPAATAPEPDPVTTAPEPEPPATAPEPEPPATAPEPDPDPVEGLFARLRAGAGGEAEDRDAAGSSIGEKAESARVDRGEAAPGRSIEQEPSAAGHESDENVRQLSSERLDPISAQLAKRLKRALQDDQNRVLERLRNDSGSGGGELVPEEVQRELFMEAATDALTDAARSGAEFSVESIDVGGAGGSREIAGLEEIRAVASEVAASLAETVVTGLRTRFDEAQGDPEAAVEHIGAAYRQWRGERIERLVGDSTLRAFSSGILSASGSDARVRWVAVGSPACADCDDNALAGSIGAGEEFPTGHRHPPAHPGCRCVIVPTSDPSP